jgi:hypothetical protein
MDYKGISDLVVVELKVVLVRVKGPGAKVEVAVLLAPGPVVIRHSLAQNLPMSSVQSSSEVIGRVEKKIFIFAEIILAKVACENIRKWRKFSAKINRC